jgi:hypothetical protein
MVTTGTLGLAGKSPNSFHKVERISARRMGHEPASAGTFHSGTLAEPSQVWGPGSEMGALTVEGIPRLQAMTDEMNTYFIGGSVSTMSPAPACLVNRGLHPRRNHCSGYRPISSLK